MTVQSPPPILDRLAELGTGGPPPSIDSIWIDGTARPADGGQTLVVEDPSTESVLANVSRGGAADVDAAAKSARAALDGSWATITPQARGNLLLALAQLIDDNADRLARLETLDVGKPLSQARSDMAGAAATLRYNAGAADKLEGISVPLGPDFVDFTELEPLGVTAHIMPWNYPLGMAMRSLAPALAAGCTAILKPAEQTPLTTLVLAELAVQAGIPAGVVNVVTGLGEEAGAALTEHPSVAGVTFTGSVETGRRVGAAAGGALKPAVLELGGKNPMIVFDDADLERAVESAIDGAFDNCGQVCSSVSRLLLHARIRAPFLERFVERASARRVAAGLDDADLGPLVSAAQHDKVIGHIESAIRDGARLCLGGGRPAGMDKGHFIAPTVFDEVNPSSPIAREETFGPVVTAFGFSDEAEALALANGLPYGLVAGIHTADIDRALRFARGLAAGSVWINGWFIGGVQAPTGGIKDSGFGRERGLAGIHNYLSIKNIGVQFHRQANAGDDASA
ncbi:aldehyde dehydrogenase family protein [Bauldia sp.]|uniref:aldehyde dehydrogenase family protein n=1 Tax=Bauldia sp. TaxID=2575872 RepID=UPI003BA9E57C